MNDKEYLTTAGSFKNSDLKKLEYFYITCMQLISF